MTDLCLLFCVAPILPIASRQSHRHVVVIDGIVVDTVFTQHNVSILHVCAHCQVKLTARSQQLPYHTDCQVVCVAGSMDVQFFLLQQM